MWIIRFQNITSSDYNYINRVLKRACFFPKKFSCIILFKATIIHVLKRKSWRSLQKEFWINYITLYNFYNSIKNKEVFLQIFHRFINKRIILFVGEKRLITKEYLDNSKDIIILTKRELESKLL